MKTHTLLRPVITEKSMFYAGKGVFTFEVDQKSSKDQIRKSIENTFAVDVTKLTVVNRKGKTKRTGRRRMPSKTSGQRIARAWLKEGQKIELFEFKEN